MDLKVLPLPALSAAIFIAIIAAVLLVPFWHALPIMAFSSTSVFLEEYPVKAFNGEEACAKINFHVPDNILVETVQLRVLSQDIPLFFEEFTPAEKDFSKEACFSTSALKAGDNRIEVLAMGKNLFFHLEKLDGAKPFAEEASIEGISLGQGTVTFTVKNFDPAFVLPVKISVNGKVDHLVYPESQTQGFEEKIKMEPGRNTVEISLNGKTVSTIFENQALPSMPFPFGAALFALSFFAFACCLFPKSGIVEKAALGMATSFVVLIALVFLLNYLGALNFYSIAGCFTAIVALTLVVFRQRLKGIFSKKETVTITPLVALAACLFLLAPIFFQVFSCTDITYWNKFYERQSALIMEQNSIPVWDGLAYLGRTYSFAPGYFLLEAGTGWVSGLQGQGLFAAMFVLSNAFLFFALFYLGRALELSDKRIAMFALFAAMSGFLLSAMTYSPRHVFSFGFFILALAFMCRRGNPAITGIFLGIMAFIQFPLLIFFPLFYLIIAKKIEWKRLAFSFAFGALFTLLLMIPNLLLYGLPFQASPEDWGYLIDYNAYYWFIDIVALLVFFVLFTLVDIAKKGACRDFYSRKLLFGFVLGTLIQLFIIYRWNILTTTNLALLIAVAFPEKALKEPIVERILTILGLVAFGFLLYGMSYLNVHEIVTTPVSFIADYTSTDARILADPMFGHDLTSVAGRSVLADLRVEYADEEKLMDAYKFLETKDYGILEKYGIDYVFNQVDYIHRQAIGGKPKYGIIEFYALDKVYSNGFIFVHRARQS
ncbi:MAG: hypothetical protein WC634_01535 [archaeon]